MKTVRFILLCLSAIFATACANYQNNNQAFVLKYDTSATSWEATLPLGNGRIGMMPDGGVYREKIVLNDITMWSGSYDSLAFSPDAIEYLPKIRTLLLAGKNEEAQALMYQHFRCGGKGSAFGNGKDAPYGCFQMLGNVDIAYRYPNRHDFSLYRRSLSLNDAMAETQFNVGKTAYKREYFASHSQDVLIVRLTANQKKSISFDIEMSRPERAFTTIERGEIVMEGQLNDGNNGDKGVRYYTRLKVINRGGSVANGDNRLSIENADEVLILISSSTDLLDKDYKNTVQKKLDTACRMKYEELAKQHQTEYHSLFNRVTIDLGQQSKQTTDRRIMNFQSNADPALAALYFQFGRYLMISGTNTSSLPLNLQGMWANTVQTPWNGDYHLNINVQMNYWPAEVCNLSDLHKPLLDFTHSLVPSGEKTAKTFYGADGWVAHMMTNPWNYTAPGEHASWGATNTGGAWLCQHVWEHYDFTRDTDYLQTFYPVLKGAADYFLSSMIEEPSHGWLVTAPSSSPENGFFLPESKNPVYVCMGPTMDVQIIRELFQNVLTASRILGMEDETTRKIKQMLPKLPPMQISKNGYLQEWLQDYEEQDPKHRHVSHLYGLYPSNQISPDKTPELAEASRVTLNRRGDAGTGWSRAWKINFWARLKDGNRAYKLFKNLLQPAFNDSLSIKNIGGTYPNLFCAHPPFQIDGNFGGTAGIAEMLIQSQNGYIELLPALPDGWVKGRFSGLRVRGGAEVDAVWENHSLQSLLITAQSDNTFLVKIPDNVKTVKGLDSSVTKQDDSFIKLRMKKDSKKQLRFAY